MKRTILIVALFVIPVLTASILLTSTTIFGEDNPTDTHDNNIQKSESNMLVVYFSHSGNTKVIAEDIKAITGADIYEIKAVDKYPQNYNEVLERSKEEIDSNFKPELEQGLESVDSYDIIFVGSPNWYNTIAPPVSTFLANFDLTGKKVVPFLTHGGGGAGHIFSDIKDQCPKSDVLDGFSCYGTSVRSAHKDVENWLKKHDLVK